MVGQAVGPGVQLGVGQLAGAVGQRHRLRGPVRVLLEAAVQRTVAVRELGRARRERERLLGAEQVERAERAVRRVQRLVQQPVARRRRPGRSSRGRTGRC